MHNKYPLWKNLALILGALLAIVYSVPNLYSEHPVVQISSKDTTDKPKLVEMVNEVLSLHTLSHGPVTMTDEGVQIQFASTDAQLLARDAIKEALGSDYTVALNLASATPSWMLALGATPMKQGLDLRGGVHFLLEVDMNGVINRRYEGLVKAFGADLREQRIRYSGIRYITNQGVEVRFREADAQQEAIKLFQQKFPDWLISSPKNGLATVISLPASELSTIRQNTLDQTMTILRNRVNELGVGEAVVQQQGASRVAVDLPGIQDAARAKQILGGTATLEFHLVDDDYANASGDKPTPIPFSSKQYTMNGQSIVLKRQVVLSGDSITSSMAGFDQQTGAPDVQIQLGGGGEALFSRITRDNIGKRMAIVFVETKTQIEERNGLKTPITHREERVISAPVIQSALGNNFQITGVDAVEAKNLSLLLRAGALPAAIYPIAERTVGPSLGKENIQRGMVSLEVGMGLILIVMLVYYRLFGLIADIALLLNLLFLCALLSIIGATLTLPGIAGIVLTVGMAVDANVLIYERIREELRRGLSVQSAIQAGYDRAFSTILDANITTLIVAVVLFSVGAGPVRGFAVTLSLGLLTSMLTGITYTRGLVNWIYGNKTVKKLSIGI